MLVTAITAALTRAVFSDVSVAAPAPPLVWTDCAPLVQNVGFNRSDPLVAFGSAYARLPLAAHSGAWCDPPCPVRDNVWGEGQNGAGLYIGFQSDAPTLWLNATLLSAPREGANCATICGSGLDLYAHDASASSGGAWRWVGTTTSSGRAVGARGFDFTHQNMSLPW